jgi:hypothetical protein
MGLGSETAQEMEMYSALYQDALEARSWAMNLSDKKILRIIDEAKDEELDPNYLDLIRGIVSTALSSGRKLTFKQRRVLNIAAQSLYDNFDDY